MASVTTRFSASDEPRLVAVTVNDASPPAVASAVLVTLMRLRSETDVTVPLFDAKSFAPLGSGVVDDTETELVTAEPEGTEESRSNVTTNVSVAPAATVPASHVIDAPWVHAGSEAPLMKVAELGGVSVRTTNAASEGPELVTERVHDTRSPATIGDVSSDLATAKSADGLVEAVDDASLFAAAGSSSVADTVASLVTEDGVPEARTTPSRATPAVPEVRSPIGQVTTPGDTSVQPGSEDAPSNVAPLGRVSVTTIPLAADGPRLVTVRSQPVASPGTGIGDGADLASAKSAARTMSDVAESTLLGPAGSGWSEDTVAELVRVVPSAKVSSMKKATLNTAELPAGTAAAKQVTVPPLNAQAESESPGLKVVPIGTASVTETFDASDGPRLSTSTWNDVPWPATAVVLFADLESERSLLWVTDPEVVDPSFELSGSPVEDDAVAVLVSVNPAGVSAARSKATVTESEVPVESEP